MRLLHFGNRRRPESRWLAADCRDHCADAVGFTLVTETHSVTQSPNHARMTGRRELVRVNHPVK